MSEDKNQEATQKHRDEAVRKGNLTQSRDLDTALIFLGMSLLIVAQGPWLLHQLQTTLTLFLSAGTSHQGGLPLAWLSEQFFLRLLNILMPLFGGALVIALLVHGSQTHFALFEGKITCSLDKLDPVRNLQNLFSMRQLTLPLLIIAKIGLLILAGYLTLRQAQPWLELPASAEAFLGDLWRTNTLLLTRSAFLMVVIGVTDYGCHWYFREKELMMTLNEVKDETKQDEGSPEIKQKLRQRMQQMSRARMISKVPQASVVLVNPTTLAIAIKYQRGSMAAPQVVAKGRDLVAERIRLVAGQHKIPIVPNKPLVRAMYDLVEVGRLIPPEFFQAVATVLAYVYRKTRGKR